MKRRNNLRHMISNRQHIPNQQGAEMTTGKTLRRKNELTELFKTNAKLTQKKEEQLCLLREKYQKQKELCVLMNEQVKKSIAVLEDHMDLIRSEIRALQDALQQAVGYQRMEIQLQEQITESDTIRHEIKPQGELTQLTLKQTTLDQNIPNSSTQEVEAEVNGREESREVKEEELERHYLERDDSLMDMVSKTEEKLKVPPIKKNCSAMKENEAAASWAQVGQGEKAQQKKEEDKQEEPVGCLTHDGQEEDRMGEQKYFWHWIYKKFHSKPEEKGVTSAEAERE